MRLVIDINWMEFQELDRSRGSQGQERSLTVRGSVAANWFVLPLTVQRP